MFNFFQSWNIRKKMMALLLLVALLPTLVVVIGNLGLHSQNLRQVISDRLVDNRRGVAIELEEGMVQILEQTKRAAAQPILLRAVAIKNMGAIEQLMASYLRLTRADIFGIYDEEGKPILVLRKDKTQESVPKVSSVQVQDGVGVSSPPSGSNGRVSAQDPSFKEDDKDDLATGDDFNFEDVDVPDRNHDKLSFEEASSTQSQGLEIKIIRMKSKPLPEGLIHQISLSGRAIDLSVQSDGIMQSTYVALEFAGSQIGSLLQGIILDQAFADGMKKRTGLEVALTHPGGEKIVSTLSGHNKLSKDNAINDVTEIKVDTRNYLYTFLPIGESEWREASGIALLQSLEPLQADQRQFAILSLAMFVLITGLVVLMSSSISNSLSQPLQLLTMTVKKISSGDFTERVPVISKDEIGQLATSFNDMTESLQESRNALISAKDYTGNIIKSMLNALIVVSPKGKIQTVNKASCTLLGYEEHELIGQPLELVFDQAPFSSPENGKTILKDSLKKDERFYKTKKGKRIPVLFTRSVMHNREGEVEGIVCLAQDISDQKKAEGELKAYSAQLQSSNRELQDFAHISSHDLQEPLRKVTAFGDRLKQKCGASLNEKGLDYLDRMLNAARRMQNLIDGLLSYSRVTTKGKPFKSVDLDKVVRGVLSDLEIRIEQTRGSVEVGELPTIDSDPLQMRQLFQNLIGNALKFNCPGDPPIVKVSSRIFNERRKDLNAFGGGELCQTTVEDNGIGFDEKYVDRIFGVFQRLHGRGEYEGTGIGLSVCRKIVERHSGTITAVSAPGKGAKFIFSLPTKQRIGD